MVVAVRAVHVAVRDLFLRRGTDVDDRRLEPQALAGELVVGVEDLTPRRLCRTPAKKLPSSPY